MKTLNVLMLLVICCLVGGTVVASDETVWSPDYSFENIVPADGLFKYIGQNLQGVNARLAARSSSGDLGVTETLRAEIINTSAIEVEVTMSPAEKHYNELGLITLNGKVELINSQLKAYDLYFGLLRGPKGENGILPLYPEVGADAISVRQGIGDTVLANGLLTARDNFYAVRIEEGVRRIEFAFSLTVTPGEAEFVSGLLTHELIVYVSEVNAPLYANMVTARTKTPVGKYTQIDWDDSSESPSISLFVPGSEDLVKFYLAIYRPEAQTGETSYYTFGFPLSWKPLYEGANLEVFAEAVLPTDLLLQNYQLEGVSLPDFRYGETYYAYLAYEDSTGFTVSEPEMMTMPEAPKGISLEILTPGVEPFYTNGNEVHFEGSVASTSDILGVTYYIDGESRWNADMGPTNGAGHYAWSFDLFFDQDGEYGVTVWTGNVDGETESTSRTVVRDTEKPLVGITTPEGDTSTTLDSIELRGFANDEYGIDEFYLELPGSSGTTAASYSNGWWSGDFGLTMGENLFVAHTKDQAGNTNLTSILITRLSGDTGDTGDTGNTGDGGDTINTPPVVEGFSEGVVYINEENFISFSEFLENASDSDGDTLTVSYFNHPDGGSIRIYERDEGYAYVFSVPGSYEITFKISDGTDEVSAKMFVTAQRRPSSGGGGSGGGNNPPPAPSNNAPVAVADTKVTYQDLAITFPEGDLTANDTDADGHSLSVSVVSAASANGGTVALVGNQITYTPPAAFTGADSFTYTVSDGNGGTDTGTVNVTVNANTAPTAVVADNAFAGFVGTTISLDASGSSDPESFLIFSWESSNPNFTFDDITLANPNLTGSSAGTGTLTCTVTDVQGLTDTATVSVDMSSALQATATSGEVAALTKGEPTSTYTGDGAKVVMAGNEARFGATGTGTVTYTSGWANTAGETATANVVVSNDNAPGLTITQAAPIGGLRPSTATGNIEGNTDNGGDANATRQKLSIVLNDTDTGGNPSQVVIKKVLVNGAEVSAPNSRSVTVSLEAGDNFQVVLERTGAPATPMQVVQYTMTLWDAGDNSITEIYGDAGDGSEPNAVRIFQND